MTGPVAAPRGAGLDAAGAPGQPDSAAFRAAIGLTEVEPHLLDRAFEATTQYCPWPKAYGGDLVAQALAAALRTVDPERATHSVHGYFLRPAEIGQVVRYEVEVLRDGRGYSSRSVRGYQGGRCVFAALASFQAPEPSGVDLALPMPAEVPDPQDLPTSAQVIAGLDLGTDERAGAAAQYWSAGRSFDMRHVPGPLFADGDRPRDTHQYLWVRSCEVLDDDPRTHQLALAYVCDYTILESVLRGAGLSWSSPGLSTASIDHALWFHRPARVDDWLLYAQEAVSAQTGRGLGTGRFYTRSGELVATVAQEGVVRVAGA